MSIPDTTTTLAGKIVAAYGVSYDRIMPPQKGYRNQSFGIVRPDGPMLNLILYKSEPGILARIRTANVVADYLAGRGFPARKTFSRKIVRLQFGLQSGHRIRYGAMYEYLDGRTIPWEAYTTQHIKLLGKTMSDMHAALANFPGAALAEHSDVAPPSVADEYLSILSRMRRYFASQPVARAMEMKLRLAVSERQLVMFGQLLAASKHLKHQQPLHMDFVRSNILFADSPPEVPLFGPKTSPPPVGHTKVSLTQREGHSTSAVRLTGILDFEKTAVGHPLCDVARTLAFLLVDCKYKSEAEVRRFFLESGYNRRGAATLSRRLTATLLEPLINLFLCYDFYKFLRHNPYESLAENAHFVRTRDLLLRRGVVTSSTS